MIANTIVFGDGSVRSQHSAVVSTNALDMDIAGVDLVRYIMNLPPKFFVDMALWFDCKL